MTKIKHYDENTGKQIVSLFEISKEYSIQKNKLLYIAKTLQIKPQLTWANTGYYCIEDTFEIAKYAKYIEQIKKLKNNNG